MRRRPGGKHTGDSEPFRASKYDPPARRPSAAGETRGCRFRPRAGVAGLVCRERPRRAWVTNDAFGAWCPFEGDVSALRERPDLEPLRFQQLVSRSPFSIRASQAVSTTLTLQKRTFSCCAASAWHESSRRSVDCDMGLPLLRTWHTSRFRRRGRRALCAADGRCPPARPHVRLSGARSKSCRRPTSAIRTGAPALARAPPVETAHRAGRSRRPPGSLGNLVQPRVTLPTRPDSLGRDRDRPTTGEIGVETMTRQLGTHGSARSGWTCAASARRPSPTRSGGSCLAAGSPPSRARWRRRYGSYARKLESPSTAVKRISGS
jgi:hypothetical protein